MQSYIIPILITIIMHNNPIIMHNNNQQIAEQ